MYTLGFDIEAAGEYHTSQLLSVAWSLVDSSMNIISQRLYVILPQHKNTKDVIDVEFDYLWSKNCWEEFGSVHKDILNATQNDPMAIKLHLEEAAKDMREYYDEICNKYNPKVGVDNSSYDCFWMSRLFTAHGLSPMEYQKNNGAYIYKGVTGYSPVIRCIKKLGLYDTFNLDSDVPNDHNPLNDSLRHAIIMMKLETYYALCSLR